MEFESYGYFSTREKAVTEIRLLLEDIKVNGERCLDENPRPFEIKEIKLDKGMQSYLKEDNEEK